MLIAVAASGTTPFTLACLREAKQRGALTIAIANNRDTPLLAEADHPIWLDTGPEPIAGSTRMKAGTAQRIALNLLSSLVMIRLGRVYRGLMVDLKAVNKKLIRRSEKILLELSGRSREEVHDALHRAQGNVKTALLLLEGCDLDEAARMLDRSGRSAARGEGSDRDWQKTEKADLRTINALEAVMAGLDPAIYLFDTPLHAVEKEAELEVEPGDER